ncbi:MAG TPA: RluA family pseudouridine synthase [Thermoanaerobaculia bacterium]|nr:RluA family pseudouridine synthase [Thermoanaerobaculia bacterium]
MSPRSEPSPPAPSSSPGLTVSASQAGQTLSALVREILPGTSWSKAKELCASGRVLVDGVVYTDPARRMTVGERMEVRLGGPAPRQEALTDLVVHLDADVAVVRKPPGILTVPFERDDRDTLIALARVAARRIEAGKGGPTLRAVQRLDKETSGLVVFARSVTAQRDLQEQLAEHTVLRRYQALVHGAARDKVYETLLLADRGDGLRGSWGVFRAAKGKPPENAREAVTRVTVLERLAGATLVSCELETGRQHQIRIHLSEAGHPLLGETVYIRNYRGPLLPAPRPMLHAATLGFVHPRTGKSLRFEDPPPPDFAAVLERLRKEKEKA